MNTKVYLELFKVYSILVFVLIGISLAQFFIDWNIIAGVGAIILKSFFLPSFETCEYYEKKFGNSKK